MSLLDWLAAPPLAHPGLWLALGALAIGIAVVVGFTPRRAAPIFGIGFAIPAVLAASRAAPGSAEFRVGRFDLVWFHADDLGVLFALVFSLVTLLGLLYGAHRLGPGETVAALLYAASAIATVLAGDWITFFVFWEAMAITSVALIWQGGTPESRRAGMRYLLVHAVGGAALFVGIVLHLSSSGGLPDLARLTAAGPPFWLILFGVGLNAAIPPLHAWLTDAYPEASTSGAVFCSALTTKTAVYALLRLFPGTELLVGLGVAMALYGVVFAVIENDVRRLLGYHIISQVGFMVAGVGIGTELALNGAAAHAYSHILYKALLFMGAGALIEATGRRKLTDLGGLFRSMPAAALLYLVGAFSISGAPLFNGFISKSMTLSAAGEAHFYAAELLLSLAAVGTFLSVGLKLPWFAFFGKDRGIVVRPLPSNLLAAMGITAALCLLYGVRPDLLYRMLPFAATYHPFTADHLASNVQLLVGAAALFALASRRLAPTATRNLDTDWIYRGPPGRAGRWVVTGARALGPLAQAVRRGALATANRVLLRAAAPDGETTGTVRRDPFSFRRPIGWTVLFAAAIVAWLFFLSPG